MVRLAQPAVPGVGPLDSVHQRLPIGRWALRGGAPGTEGYLGMVDQPAGRDVAADLPVDVLLASMSDGFVALDDDWRFVLVNPAAERVWGRRADELIGRTVYEALGVPPDNPFNQCYLASKASGEPVSFSAFSQLRGTWLEVRGVPRPGGYSIFFRDVSADRQTYLDGRAREHALRSADAINQRIFETSVDLILVSDRTGTLLRVSPSVQHILGYAAAELEGQNAIGFIHPDDLDPTREQMRRARREGGVCAFDARYMHKDGRAVPMAWKGIWSASQERHFFIGRDMTDRLEAEAQLRHAQRLEAVGRLTGGIAHDFNNLLQVVLGNLDLILARDDVGEEVRQCGRTALRAVERGSELTRRLLAFARQQPLRPTTLYPNEVLIGWVDVLRQLVGEHIEVTFQPAASTWPVHIDAANLETAIANLAANARDAMPGGGKLLIQTGNAVLDDDYVRLNPEASPGDYVVIVVTDTGEGMTPEVLAHVFEPFFTTKDVGHGTGLGLATVFGFVKQSGGHIKAYSEAGLGTSIRLYLPRASAAEEGPVASPPTAAEPAASTSNRILVVEDNEMLRVLLLRQLETLGYVALEAGNAVEALAIIDAGVPIDLLFTDIVMPGGMNGDTLAREALARRPGLKVLLTSGFPGETLNGEDALQDTALLAKPYRIQELARRLREVLEG
jgi:PAS domain S-box-containing protein